jgi:hypothetical protein
MSESMAELEMKIIADLKKSGFGSELVAVNVFAQKGWRVFAGGGGRA